MGERMTWEFETLHLSLYIYGKDADVSLLAKFLFFSRGSKDFGPRILLESDEYNWQFIIEIIGMSMSIYMSLLGTWEYTFISGKAFCTEQ